jgi:hypothetical protein
MSEPAEEGLPPPSTVPQTAAKRERPAVSNTVIVAASGLLILIAVIAATPFWAVPVMRALPWGGTENVQEMAKSATPPAPVPDPAIAAVKAQVGQNAAALQQLAQRLASLEARPVPQAPDLGPIEQQLGALAKTTADLKQSVTALDKAAQARPAADPKNTALALVLLQIREAVDLGRPFAAEYQALMTLAGDHLDVAAAAAPLAGSAEDGVVTRAVLAERLRQLAPQIATAAPPAPPDWTSQIIARLRGLVTIRRIGGAGQSPAEAAAGAAQHDLAAGDLAGAVAALERLDGAAAAAEPWLRMAKDRLAAEAALRRTQAVLAAALGTAAVPAGKS